MNNLKNKLLQEKQYLEKILNDSTKLKKPHSIDGRLRISKDRDCFRYYLNQKNENNTNKSLQYLKKSERHIAAQLAEQEYLEDVINLIQKRLKQINRMLKDYEDDEIDQIFLHEHPGRQSLITPVQPTWEMQLKKWESIPYRGLPFGNDTNIRKTARGERVRSKSEIIIANHFFYNGIPYKYECPLYLEHFGYVYPDFTMLSRKTRKEVYWEHCGMMDDQKYVLDFVKKIQHYEDNGIYPGVQLILTFETSDSVISTDEVKYYADKYL